MTFIIDIIKCNHYSPLPDTVELLPFLDLIFRSEKLIILKELLNVVYSNIRKFAKPLVKEFFRAMKKEDNSSVGLSC